MTAGGLRRGNSPRAAFTLALCALCACDASGTVGITEDASPVSAPSDGATDGQTPTPPPPDDAGPPPSVDGLRALRIDPATAILVEDGVGPGERAVFVATGTFDGGDRDLSSVVQWGLSNPALGSIVAGQFTSGGVGGHTRVIARAQGFTAEAELTVRLQAVVRTEGVPPTADALFPDDESGDRQDPARLRVVYPSDATMFPKNIERVTHQWNADNILDLFEVRFRSDVLDLKVYTSDRRWQPDAQTWRWLADSHPGESLQMSVRGLAMSAASTVYRSQAVELLYSRSEVLGALYYWSTSSQGIMKATLASPVATKFFPPPGAPDADTCVSCHTVSRDGRRMAVAYDGERLRQVSVPERVLQIPVDPADEGEDFGWGTYNPGATLLLYAHKGELTLRDADTGRVLRTLDFGKDAWVTHPDWSPDGRFVAVTYKKGGKAPGNKDISGSSIARFAVHPDGTFGPLEILFESDGRDDTLYYPSYSPDSQWLAFVRADGKSKDNPSAELFLLPAAGGQPVALTRLNRRVADADGVLDVGNSMPTWAPSTTPDEVFWLAFSSLRDYGNVLVGQQRDQLWGGAIDTRTLGAVADPSYAAFWMPFQQVDESNHRAFWALDSTQTCPSEVELCDGVDNDCDAIVDEDCCIPAPEVCGDGVDNDCDGTADEGCGCGDSEVCDNDQDDDCDGLVDAADEDCIII